MVALITYSSSGGDCGRCDAKCYDAQSPPSECDCICGGKNHAAGLDQATGNTRELGEQWITQARAAGQDVTNVAYALAAQHEPLF